MSAGSVQTARKDYEYDYYLGDTRHAALGGRFGIAHLDAGYLMTGAAPPSGWVVSRGNLTAVTRWNNNGASVITSRQYDAAGNVVQTMDGRAMATSIDFGSSGTTYAFPLTITDALGYQKRFTWDGNLGQVSSSQEQIDGAASTATFATTTAVYNDALDRLTDVTRPDGGTTHYGYDDAGRSVTSTTAVAGDAHCATGFSMVSSTTYDGLGRASRSTRVNADGTTLDGTRYDGVGRGWQCAKPY